MKMNDFLEACDATFNQYNPLNPNPVLQECAQQQETVESVVGEFEDFEDDFSEKSVASNDFDDDFGDDFENDFSDDFEAGENTGVTTSNAFGSAESKDIQPTLDTVKGIQSAHIEIQEDSCADSIEKEINDFLDLVGASSAENLRERWNLIYVDDCQDEKEVILKYLRVRYGIWFRDQLAEDIAIAQPANFFKLASIDTREMTAEDIKSLSSAWDKEWFKKDIVCKYAVTSRHVPVVLGILQNGKSDISEVDEYLKDEDVLFAALRLVQAGRFIANEFQSSVEQGDYAQYTEGTLSKSEETFRAVEQRSDIVAVKASLTSESLDEDVSDLLREYRDARYLPQIITASKQGRHNASFVNMYLIKDLGSFDFIADEYADGSVDVSIDPSNYWFCQIVTDLRNQELRYQHLYSLKEGNWATLLVCSYKLGKLSDIGYNCFLALLANSMCAERVIADLNKKEKKISNFYDFIFEQIVQGRELEAPEGMVNNYVVLRIQEERVNTFYLAAEDYYLNHDNFMEISNNCNFGIVMQDKEGIVLSNVGNVSLNKVLPHCLSSITTWASGKCDVRVIQQFKDKCGAEKANLLRVMQMISSNRNQALNTAMQDYLTMEYSDYCVFDRAFGYVADHPELLGLLTVPECKQCVLLLSNTYSYGNLSQVLFMFIYTLVRCYAKGKDKIILQDFGKLGADKNNIILNGYKENIPCMHYRSFADSISSVIQRMQSASEVILRVSGNSICLTFS